MDLKDYIIEAISSGKNRSESFPLSHDFEVVEDWLLKNGFTLVSSQIGSSIGDTDVRFFIRKYGERIFNYGNFDSPGTHWIEFGDKDFFFKMRLGNDYEAFLDSDVSMCSLREIDLNKRDPKYPRSQLSTRFNDIEDFAKEVDRRLL